MQNFARKEHVSIDTITFDFDVSITVKIFYIMCEGVSVNKRRSYTPKVPLSPTLDAKKTVKLQIRG